MQRAQNKPRRISFPVLVSRWVFFLFFMCLFVIFLYAVGSIQGFMDTTQLFLLNLASFLSLFLSAGALFGFVQALYLFFRKTQSRKYLLRALFYAFLTILGIAAALTAIIIITGSGGNADLGSVTESFGFGPPLGDAP